MTNKSSFARQSGASHMEQLHYMKYYLLHWVISKTFVLRNQTHIPCQIDVHCSKQFLRLNYAKEQIFVTANVCN